MTCNDFNQNMQEVFQQPKQNRLNWNLCKRPLKTFSFFKLSLAFNADYENPYIMEINFEDHENKSITNDSST